jgi:L-rhamnose isomerase
MTATEGIEAAYTAAKNRYAEIGVDTEKAMDALGAVKISLHCWQGDDVRGFLSNDALSGGIMTTGNYPGAARNAAELRDDIEKALSFIPGKHKVNLHAIYLDTDEKVDLDAIEPKHFARWADWAKQRGLGLDFNPTFYSHPMLRNNMSLSHPDKAVRDFWIEHGKRCRTISEYLGRETGQVSIDNFWVPDGMKDTPADRLGMRQRLLESYDAIFSEAKNDAYTLDAVEGKVFGIGVESFTTGSHEFYSSYALTHNKLITLDTGHYHPTEMVSDKLSAFYPFAKGLMLHVSRPVRWDSDHVTILDDELRAIAREIVRGRMLDKVHIGLDYFDATVNRVAAWVVGMRAMQKALLEAFLEPAEKLRDFEHQFDYPSRLVWNEELKVFPMNAVWDEFCLRNSVPAALDWYDDARKYETNVQLKRA